jgi:hypothetical protein
VASKRFIVKWLHDSRDASAPLEDDQPLISVIEVGLDHELG